MNYFDKALPFILGVALTIAVVAIVGTNFPTLREAEGLRIRIAALEQTVSDAEARMAATRQLSKAREARSAARTTGDQEAVRTAFDELRKANADLSALRKKNQQDPTTAPQVADGGWHPLHMFGRASGREVEEAKAKIAALERALQGIESQIQAEVERSRRASMERLAEERARREADAVTRMAAADAARRDRAAEADAAAARRYAGASKSPAAQQRAEAIYQQASTLESGGRAGSAVRVYRQAARAGSGKAAKRLGDIYACGVPGVPRDYAESLQWYDTARQLGEAVPSRLRC